MNNDDDSRLAVNSGGTVPQVSEAVWRRLFEAADAVREAQPWKVLVDGDWFAMAHPDSESGEVSIGSVMGHANRMVGVQLYRSPEGVRFWNDTLKNGEPDFGQLRFHNRMLDAEFLAKGRLHAEDHRIRQQLGLPKLPNKGRPYPCFRSMKPQMLPWFLDEDEARLLAIALRLSIRQADYFVAMGGAEKVDYPKGDDGRLIIPTYRLKDGGDAGVVDDWLMTKEPMPQAPEEADLIDATPEEGLVARLQDLPKSAATWQAGSLNIPVPLAVEAGACFPRVVLLVEAGSSRVIGHGTENPAVNAGVHYRKSFVETAESAQALPSVLHVNGPVAKKALSELAEAMAIEVEVRFTLDEWFASANALVESVAKGYTEA